MTEDTLDNSTSTSFATPLKESKIMGPGARLRQLREVRHLQLEEMAKRLRLTPERLTQLEEDDYQLMGAPAFAKGYLRAYASQLGVAKEEILTILQAFDQLSLGENIQHNKPELIHEKIDQSNHPKTARWVSYLMVLLLLALLGYFWYNHLQGLNKATTEQVAETTVPVSIPETTNEQSSTTTTLPVAGGLPEIPAQNTSSTTPLNLSPPATTQPEKTLKIIEE